MKQSVGKSGTGAEIVSREDVNSISNRGIVEIASREDVNPSGNGDKAEIASQQDVNPSGNGGKVEIASQQDVNPSGNGDKAELASQQDVKSRRSIHAKLLIVPVAVIYLLLAFLAMKRGNSLLIGIVLVLLSMAPFLWRFERRERQARELVLIAVMAAVASVSRIPFASLLPSFTPVTFIVIISGIVFGAEAGWMVGAVTGLVSNFFLGQGPWTPWQMFAWGMAGFTAGLFAHRSPLCRRRLPLLLFGAAWGFLYDWILNVTVVLDLWVRERSWSSVGAVYALSLPFEVIHASANVFFLSVFGTSWIKLLERYRRKYGALQRTDFNPEGKEETPYGQTSASH